MHNNRCSACHGQMLVLSPNTAAGLQVSRTVQAILYVRSILTLTAVLPLNSPAGADVSLLGACM